MNTPPEERWDLGQAVEESWSGIAKGVMDFFGLVMKPFENCGLGGQESEELDNKQMDEDSVATNDHLVVRGDLRQNKNQNRRLTEETLGRLSTAGAVAYCGPPTGSTRTTSNSSNSSNSLNNISTEGSLSGSMSCEDGGSDDGVVSKGTKPRVTFDHGVDVRITWRQHLACMLPEANPRRDRAAAMVDGDDFSNIVETAPASATRTAILQPSRGFSRAAHFAMMGEDDKNKVGRQPMAYGRMKDIISSAGGGGISVSGGDVDNDNEGEGEEEEGLINLFGSYDGSWAGMKRIVFLPTLSSSLRVNGRLAKKLSDPSALVSRSPAQWMTRTELDDILSRTKGWKEGAVGSNSGRGGDRRARRKTSHGFDGKLESRPTSVSHEMCRVSVDNTTLKEELFGLAMEEHRAALLFKRAYLN